MRCVNLNLFQVLIKPIINMMGFRNEFGTTTTSNSLFCNFQPPIFSKESL